LITIKQQKLQVTAFLIFGSFVTAHLCLLLLPNIFSTLNAHIADKIFSFRTHIEELRPSYDNTVIHVDIDETSIRQLGDYYLSRSYHAQVIRNLADMNAAAILYDSIIAAPVSEVEDRALIDSASAAANVYFGMALRFVDDKETIRSDPARKEDNAYLDDTKWRVKVVGEPRHFHVGVNGLITFPALAAAAKGLGYLNVNTDPDGVIRRLPLLVLYQDAFYPSFSFRAVCDYFQVPPENIVVNPGSAITLTGARRPGETKGRDIVIPIDDKGNMTINFIGPWERMDHAHYVDVYRASEDRHGMEIWEEVLKGKIVLVSEVHTASPDWGSVPTDNEFPMSGVHANAIHTILTESFIKELTRLDMLWIEIPLMLLIFLMCAKLSSLPFTVGTVAVGLGYVCFASASIIFANVAFHFVRPLTMIFIALTSILVVNAIESAFLYGETKKAKELAERDLEIGRQIQAGFFPDRLPSMSGWKVAARFKPARQVAGDFYDVFPLVQGIHLAIVMGDVCGKGVGAALFMALFRSLIRVFALETAHDSHIRSSHLEPSGVLKRTVTLTNNYIATTHGHENMFATLFFGILNTRSGLLTYTNCGHEHPMVISNQGIKAALDSTGPVVGLLQGSDFVTREIELERNETLFTYTDGVIDAQSESGEFFTEERLVKALVEPVEEPGALLERVMSRIQKHIGDGEQYDDLTMLAIYRREEA
jgi:serine phosphatase RsbU (regulator of sigma subunit)/CHASE2 domain-containing sensor protein